MSNPTLGHPPLALTLAQVKFNAVPTMEAYAKDIQNEFRKKLGFIHHGTEETTVIRIAPHRTEPVKTMLWSSAAPDYKTRLILGDDFLVLETTEYHGFDDFIPNLQKALGIVHDVTEVTHVTRLGFRYINRIETITEKPLEYYLNPQLLGFSFDKITSETAVSRTEAIAKTPEGQLRVHCMQFYSEQDALKNLLLPPDISTALEVKPVSTEPLGKYAFLDIDHFRDFDRELISFDIPDVVARLDQLHQRGYNAFISGVTEDAIKEWG